MPAPTAALLDAVVTAMGGATRPGQVEMAKAVAAAATSGRHLLVQAGTGTGKSLAYLVPALAHAVRTRKPVVVSTATLALQSQLVERDVPTVSAALRGVLGREPRYALVKGRNNYVCVHKLHGGYPEESEESLFGPPAPTSVLGAEIARVREWAETTESGDRHHLEPGVSERAWRTVSVSARECLGQKCPQVNECFVERARRAARESDVIVTNHTFLAIDAFEERGLLPEHDLVVIDEAHEFIDKVTATITEGLTPAQVRAAGKHCAGHTSGEDVLNAADALDAALSEREPGRLASLPSDLNAAVSSVLAAAREASSSFGRPGPGAEADTSRVVAKAALAEIVDTAARLVEPRPLDVVWVERDFRDVPALMVAPLSVASRMRSTLLESRTVVMTSATLAIGGNFSAVASGVGLSEEHQWTGIDVGSPFSYAQQAMAYVAAHLPAPTRDGAPPAAMDHLEELIRAAGGRTLGLFSSRKAAQAAAEAMRERLGDGFPMLCQDDDQLPALVRAFAGDPRTCLFGTLSLWQGVDVPGSACQLVVIDRIPFPRPDLPLHAARTEAVNAVGGNGFMAVSATHAALLLAQGAGRLIRALDDRGVVAFLDSRLATARYAGFIQRSLPPMWPTTDPSTVLAALRRLDESAPAITVKTTVEATSDGAGWTASEDEELRDGIGLGLPLAELAAHVGRAEADVEARAHRIGAAR